MTHELHYLAMNENILQQLHFPSGRVPKEEPRGSASLKGLTDEAILSCILLTTHFYPGNVLALQVTKPQGFKYTSGQYMFVNCADVSPFEW